MSNRNKTVKTLVGTSLLSLSTLFSPNLLADAVADALSSGKASGDFRLRYETVDQDNALKDADALTLRTRIGYTTGTVSNFSGTIEFEDVRVVGGIDDYNSTQNGNGTYSVIADPETTEVDQAFIQYKDDLATVKYGRQVVTLDNHRFVGHVGWRQDRQTFDAFSSVFTPAENLKLTYAYLFKRNAIFAEARDMKSKDHLLNASYTTSVGTITGYGYLLEQDDASELSYDTFGLRFTGATELDSLKLLYTAEYATQEKDDRAGADFEADYMLLEGGIAISGITAKLGYEVLGSDDGDYGFATPLATLHKFNGWADQFLATPNQGLVDTYVSVGGGLAGGKWAVIYHEFEADEEKGGIDDLGDEIDLVYSRPFGKTYSAGIKYAAYSAGDTKVDADKLWVWVGAKF